MQSGYFLPYILFESIKIDCIVLFIYNISISRSFNFFMQAKTRLELNIEIAQEALQYCRKIIPIEGSYTHPSLTDKEAFFQVFERVRHARNNNLTPAESLIDFLTCENTTWSAVKKDKHNSKRFKVGNCGELSQLAINYLKKKNISNASLFHIYGSDHAIVIMDIDYTDPSWGASCVVLDPLLNEIYPINQISSKLQCYTCDPNRQNPHILTPWTPDYPLISNLSVFYEVDQSKKTQKLINYSTTINQIKRCCQQILTSEKLSSIENYILFLSQNFNTKIQDKIGKHHFSELTNFELERIITNNIKKIIYCIQDNVDEKSCELIFSAIRAEATNPPSLAECNNPLLHQDQPPFLASRLTMKRPRTELTQEPAKRQKLSTYAYPPMSFFTDKLVQAKLTSSSCEIEFKLDKGSLVEKSAIYYSYLKK